MILTGGLFKEHLFSVLIILLGAPVILPVLRFHRDAGADALPANARSCQQALEPFRAQNILSSAQRRTASLTERAKKHFEYTGTVWHRWSRQVRCLFRNIRLVACDRLHTDVTVVPYLCNGCFLPRERLCHADETAVPCRWNLCGTTVSHKLSLVEQLIPL